MDKIIIDGGKPLRGVVPIGGAKNATLPILVATLVAPGEHRLARVPDLADVGSMLSLLGRIGCPSLGHAGLVSVDTTRVIYNEAPYDLVRKMRASVLALGPLLARCGEAHVSLPGGCAIGVRPIDQHLKGLEALGCQFELSGGYVHGKVDQLTGGRVRFDMPTVTGTENVLMAAVLAQGESVFENAAREPEIVDLVRFLRSLGAIIEGEGTSTLHVQGVASLTPAKAPYGILPDRVEAGTYLVAGAITGGDITIQGVNPGDLSAVLDALLSAGCTIDVGDDTVRVRREGPVRTVNVTTEPHPGFPTDMQAQRATPAHRRHGHGHGPARLGLLGARGPRRPGPHRGAAALPPRSGLRASGREAPGRRRPGGPSGRRSPRARRTARRRSLS